MASSAGSKVLYELDGVFIHNNPESGGEQDSLISGCLRLLEKDGDIVVEYKPTEDNGRSAMLCAAKESSSVFEWGPIKGRSPGQRCVPGEGPQEGLDRQLSCETEWDMVHTVQFRKANCEGAFCRDPVEVPRRRPPCRAPQLEFSIGDLVSVRVKEEGWAYLVLTVRGLELPALHFHQGGSEDFLNSLGQHLQLTESATDASLLQVSVPSKALSRSVENLLDDATFGLISKFTHDPVTTTLGGFSKVTNYLYGAFHSPGTEILQHRPDAEVGHLDDIIPGLDINQQDEPGFEVITRMDLGERPAVRRGEPLGMDDWNQNMDPEGRMINVSYLRRAIFKGGMCHALRKEGWKFLLSYFPWDSTREERRSLTQRKTDEYFRMKLQWKSVSEEQEKRNSRLRDHRSLIEKDVNRTDRTNPFYEGADNPGLVLLHDILRTYCMYDFDLGYVQGMSDLLSPILFVMENEVDAFWCFVSFMDQMHQNFEEQMQGMKTQLAQLSTLLQLLDITFWNYLGNQDSGHLYFCFRWLLIRFKRELIFHDVLRLWEVIWTGLPCQNFHLLVCCAVLDSEKQKIMEEQYSFNEILKHVNELSMKLDIRVILQKAEAMCLQLKSCKDLPSPVMEILGFSNPGTPSSSRSQDRPDSPGPSASSENQQDFLDDLSPDGNNRHSVGS
uniref:TBC1 domain family member 15 n=1 Tax=Esox lucius TaxID=8010 RepID=A0A3P8Y6R1_ESOLU